MLHFRIYFSFILIFSLTFGANAQLPKTHLYACRIDNINSDNRSRDNTVCSKKDH